MGIFVIAATAFVLEFGIGWLASLFLRMIAQHRSAWLRNLELNSGYTLKLEISYLY